MWAQFGPAGNPDAFYEQGYKASVDMPAWLAGQGLSAYEYQLSRGVNVREDTARAIGQKAVEHGVRLSVHAPYYISLATEDETTAANTKRHFSRSLEAARWLGADRVIFHIGGAGKRPRSEAFAAAQRLFEAVLKEAEHLGLADAGIKLAPETHGKANQLGNLEEVIALCKMADWMIPAVDFGHLHAVSGGAYTTYREYEQVFEQVAAGLGDDAASQMHIHFSHLEFTGAGEKRHWTFADPYGPPHEPLMEVISSHRLAPRVICESAGTQAHDARIMQDYYRSLLKE